MTPRELAAHRTVLRSSREFSMSLHAGIQATLYNVNRDSKDSPVFTPDMFMPGYEAKQSTVPKWKQERDRMMQGFKKARMGDPMSREENRQTVVMLDDRARRAREAKEQGKPREVIDQIMRGVA